MKHLSLALCLLTFCMISHVVAESANPYDTGKFKYMRLKRNEDDILVGPFVIEGFKISLGFSSIKDEIFVPSKSCNNCQTLNKLDLTNTNAEPQSQS